MVIALAMTIGGVVVTLAATLDVVLISFPDYHVLKEGKNNLITQNSPYTLSNYCTYGLWIIFAVCLFFMSRGIRNRYLVDTQLKELEQLEVTSKMLVKSRKQSKTFF